MLAPASLKATQLALSPRALSTCPAFPAKGESHFNPVWGPQPQQPPYLGDGGLKDNVADGLRGRAKHGNHHHKHIGPLGQGILSKVEEDAEAVLIIHRHREDAACGKGRDRQQSASRELALQQRFPITQTPYK